MDSWLDNEQLNDSIPFHAKINNLFYSLPILTGVQPFVSTVFTSAFFSVTRNDTLDFILLVRFDSLMVCDSKINPLSSRQFTSHVPRESKYSAHAVCSFCNAKASGVVYIKEKLQEHYFRTTDHYEITMTS